MGRAPLAVAGVCVALLAACYVVALGTHAGLAFDRSAFDAFAGRPHAYELGSVLVFGLDVGSVLLVTVAIVGLACLQRRFVDGAAALATIGCSIATTEALKPLLGRLDPLGGDALRDLHSSFPSGHTTAAASLGAALVVAVPRRFAVAAAIVGAVYAAAIGAALVAIGSHYPSDVAGGLLVVCAWSSLSLGASERFRPRLERAVARRRAPPLAPELVQAVGVVVAAGLALAAPVALYLRGHAGVVVGHRFALAAIGIAVVAAAVFSAIATLATRRSSRAAA